MNSEIKKPASGQVALATIIPFVIALWSGRLSLLLGERFGFDTIPLILVGWCVLLGLSAAWLNRVVFGQVKTLLPFLVAVLVIFLVWLWQRLAFVTLVPHSGLTYGYFLEPRGRNAGFWVLTVPLRAGLTCISACFVTSVLVAWRAGLRGLLACIIPWWLTAYLVFLLPSMYLDAQGNASVFI